MGERRVLVAGCGSVGSRIAEDLARSGVRHFVLVDPDEVSLPNMARSVYARADVGRAKVAVLAERLRGIAPETEVSTTRRFLREITPEDILDGVDLVVLATDDMTEQAALAKAAYEKRIVQVAAAMYRKAAAGEVMIAVPEARTPCWACAVGTSALSTSERPDTNYGVDGRLVAESGLGASINLVTSVASLLAIGLLAGPGSPAGAGLGRMLAESRVLGLIDLHHPGLGFLPGRVPRHGPPVPAAERLAEGGVGEGMSRLFQGGGGGRPGGRGHDRRGASQNRRGGGRCRQLNSRRKDVRRFTVSSAEDRRTSSPAWITPTRNRSVHPARGDVQE